MKNQKLFSSSRSGFTLIELLVVIAIIVVLAAMGFGVGMAAINHAKKVTAQNDCTNLVIAIQSYYDDYNALPEIAAADTPPGVRTDNELMDILLGFDEDANPRKTRYFTTREASGASSARAFNGIYYSSDSAELFDPWKKVTGNAAENRHYFVMLDTLGYGQGTSTDEVLSDPITNKPLYGRLAVAWSTGKDGQYALGDQTADVNRDNVYSWKK